MIHCTSSVKASLDLHKIRKQDKENLFDLGGIYPSYFHYRWPQVMESPKSVLVIYRLKFKSKPGFDNAVQVLRFGEKFRSYIESIHKAFFLKLYEQNYSPIIPPEINLCKDDLVIYVCSYEDARYLKDYSGIDIMSKRPRENMPKLPYYYEAFLKSTFGSIADLSIAAGDP